MMPRVATIPPLTVVKVHAQRDAVIDVCLGLWQVVVGGLMVMLNQVEGSVLEVGIGIYVCSIYTHICIYIHTHIYTYIYTHICVVCGNDVLYK